MRAVTTELILDFTIPPRDWHHPDCDSDENHPRYIKWCKAQMTELLNNYGSQFTRFGSMAWPPGNGAIRRQK
jgi:hypothetical protein